MCDSEDGTLRSRKAFFNETIDTGVKGSWLTFKPRDVDSRTSCGLKCMSGL
jgi:hypothetical protein